MQVCDWKTEAMFRRYAIVKMRDLRSAVENAREGHNGGTIEGAGVAEYPVMRRLSHFISKCPGRDSNPHEVTLKGF
jgi:hypothetical protein